MDSKLTLRLDASVISQIKYYAMKHRLSVSSLTEGLYKKILVEENLKDDDIATPIALKYRGILGDRGIDTDRVRLERLKSKHLA